MNCKTCDHRLGGICCLTDSFVAPEHGCESWTRARVDPEPPWDELDPGIEDVVRLLWHSGMFPTDSGDGHKPACCPQCDSTDLSVLADDIGLMKCNNCLHITSRENLAQTGEDFAHVHCVLDERAVPEVEVARVTRVLDRAGVEATVECSIGQDLVWVLSVYPE